jgi:hypothetical protein
MIPRTIHESCLFFLSFKEEPYLEKREPVVVLALNRAFQVGQAGLQVVERGLRVVFEQPPDWLKVVRRQTAASFGIERNEFFFTDRLPKVKEQRTVS